MKFLAALLFVVGAAFARTPDPGLTKSASRGPVLPSFSLENPSARDPTGVHALSWGQAFLEGTVPAGMSLHATVNGAGVPTQLDCKVNWPKDNSCRWGIITINAPNIRPSSGSKGNLMLAMDAGTPVNIANVCRAWHQTVKVEVLSPSVATFNTDICALVSAALQNKSSFQGSISGTNLSVDSVTSGAIAVGQYLTGKDVPFGTVVTGGSSTKWTINNPLTLDHRSFESTGYSTWRSGPQVTEIRVEKYLTSSLYLRIDVASFQDGSVRTDVQLNNDRALTDRGGLTVYNERIEQNGVTVKAWERITQYQYQDRHDVIWSNGAPKQNIKRDIGAFEKSNMIPWIDLQMSVGTALANYATIMADPAKWGGPLPVNQVDTTFGSGGGDPPFGWLGMINGASAVWLITQDHVAENFALGWADAGGSIPWHMWDPSIGFWVSVDQHPSMWFDGRGNPSLTQPIPDSKLTGWYINGDFPLSHEPELSYIPYILTGSRYYLDMLNAQANFSILYMYPEPRNFAPTGDIMLNAYQETREQAWAFKMNLYAHIANQDHSFAKAYFERRVRNNLAWAAGKVKGTNTRGHPINLSSDLTYGAWPGVIGVKGAMSVFSQDYLIATMAFAKANGYSDAGVILDYISHWQTQSLRPHPGWNTHDGATYLLTYWDGAGSFYPTWNKVTPIHGGGYTAPWTIGNYPELALQALAFVISEGSGDDLVHDAMQAYGWLISQQNAYGALYSSSGFATGTSGFFTNPEHSVRPRMPDGTIIYRNQIQFDSSDNNVKLTSTGGTSILATHGKASDTLVGGSGGDLLVASTSGHNTLLAGTGNQFLFGGYQSTGTNVFIDNIGDNFMRGCTEGTCVNVYQFGTDKSGRDIIDNFRPGTDTLKIKSRLDEHKFSKPADFTALCAVSGGSTVCDLGRGNTITLKGVTTSLTSSVRIF